MRKRERKREKCFFFPHFPPPELTTVNSTHTKKRRGNGERGGRASSGIEIIPRSPSNPPPPPPPNPESGQTPHENGKRRRRERERERETTSMKRGSVSGCPEQLANFYGHLLAARDSTTYKDKIS